MSKLEWRRLQFSMIGYGMIFSGFGILFIGGLFGAYGLTDEPATPYLNAGVEHLLPTKDDRQLNTSTLHVFLREKKYEPLNLKMRLGVGATRVTGSITQLVDAEGGGVRSATLDSPAWGAGPEVEASFRLFGIGPLSTHADFLGGVYLFDRAFPAGGMRYDGVLQTGLHLEYTLSRDSNVSLGWRWMHESNGHGTKPSNPGYEAAGVMLRYSRAL